MGKNIAYPGLGTNSGFRHSLGIVPMDKVGPQYQPRRLEKSMWVTRKDGSNSCTDTLRCHT
jgi:hypothetical protein